MRTKDQAGAAERTAVSPADLPSAARRADEFTARRRGALRTYFYSHPRVMDVVVVISYLLAGSGIFLSGDPDVNMSEHVVIVLASATVLMFRRDKPLAVLAIVSVFEVLNIVVVPTASNIGVGIWFALYAVAVRYKTVISFALGIISAVPLMAFMLFLYQYPADLLSDNGPSAATSSIISAIVMLLSNIIATGVGAAVRSNRKHEAELRQWAIRNAELASVAERNRIAREMHDVVAHSLTVMVALSDGAAVVVKRDPAKAGDVLGQLSQTGRTALADMRRVLGVLRADGGTNRSPQPDHTDMGALIEGFRQAGLPISFTQSGPPLPADPALALTVYRIVQESLTNVLRYGTAVSRVEVMVANNSLTGAITVRIRDDGHGTLDASIGSGRGIVGMRERARIYAGTVDAGPVPQGGWLVTVALHPGESTPVNGQL
ncbi:sensor histidine kinase [Arthrobacter sp. N199823]|uniref:sensor histidine kinase n=1 Tax=Arthrobacter sp. N199823 TaxID=2058895 RepID=UPI002157745D|nr:histidine kinase [Arthrobacter sp. N199823]